MVGWGISACFVGASGCCSVTAQVRWPCRRIGPGFHATKKAQQCWVEWVGLEGIKKAPEVRPIGSGYGRHRLEACATATTHGFGTIEGRPAPLGATRKAQKRDPAKISGPCPSPSLTSWIAHPRGLSRGGNDANRATKKVQKRDPSPSSRRWEARRCGGAMGRTVARQAQDDGGIRRLRADAVGLWGAAS